MTGFTGWKQALPDGRKFSAVEKNELFGTDFEGTRPVCLFTIYCAQASVNGS